MPKFWMINDRDKGGIGVAPRSRCSYLLDSGQRPLNKIAAWTSLSEARFRRLLAAAVNKFPAVAPEQNGGQSHVTILIHGYSVSFEHSTAFNENLCTKLFDGNDSLGLCILHEGRHSEMSWGTSRSPRSTRMRQDASRRRICDAYDAIRFLLSFWILHPM
jgi:hypothetical protein